jgi:hypothetical protein
VVKNLKKWDSQRTLSSKDPYRHISSQPKWNKNCLVLKLKTCCFFTVLVSRNFPLCHFYEHLLQTDAVVFWMAKYGARISFRNGCNRSLCNVWQNFSRSADLKHFAVYKMENLIDEWIFSQSEKSSWSLPMQRSTLIVVIGFKQPKLREWIASVNQLVGVW